MVPAQGLADEGDAQAAKFALGCNENVATAAAEVATAPPKKRRRLPASFEGSTPEPMPWLSFGGELRYVADAVASEQEASALVAMACAEASSGRQLVLGLDAEWRVTFAKGEGQRKIALLQIYDDKRDCCVLFHLSSIAGAGDQLQHTGVGQRREPGSFDEAESHTVTPALRQLLCDRRLPVLFVGVGVAGDLHKLWRDYGVDALGRRPAICKPLHPAPTQADTACENTPAGTDTSGGGALDDATNGSIAGGSGNPRGSADTPEGSVARFLDLRDLLRNKSVKCIAQPPQTCGLAMLCEALLRKRVEKSDRLRCSDWEKAPLDPEQKAYAALDAMASLNLYHTLSAFPDQPSLPAAVAEPDAVPHGKAGEIVAEAGTLDLERQQGALHYFTDLGRSAVSDRYVPERNTVAVLTPAKHRAWEAVVNNTWPGGHPVQAVAAHLRIRVATLLSYLADGIQAGNCYRWAVFSISDRALAHVERALRVWKLQQKQQQNHQQEEPQQPHHRQQQHLDIAALQSASQPAFADIRTILGNAAEVDPSVIRLCLAHLARLQEWEVYTVQHQVQDSRMG